MIPNKCKTCGNLKHNKCAVMLETYEGCPAWTDNPDQVIEADAMTKQYSGWLAIRKYLKKRNPSKRGEKKDGLSNIITEKGGAVNC